MCVTGVLVALGGIVFGVLASSLGGMMTEARASQVNARPKR